MSSRLLAAFCLISSVASQLPAATLQFTGILGSTRVVRTINPSGTGTSAATDVGVGLLSYLNLGIGDTMYFYCFEPQQGTGLPGTIIDYTVDPSLLSAPLNNGGISSTTATAIRLLLGQLANPFSPGLTAIEQAGMQVAIWELVRETASGPYSVNSGVVTFTNNASFAGVIEQAQVYLNAVNAGSGTPYTGAVALVSSGFQDLVGLQPIPEPATFALAGAGLIGLALVRRRRQR